MEGSGIFYQAAGSPDRIPPFDKRSGNHFWIVLAGFRVVPDGWESRENVQLDLDSENLVTIQGPGCYYCESAYSTLIASRRCKGTHKLRGKP